MKKKMLLFTLLMSLFTGCGSFTHKTLEGQWKSAVIESEWGPPRTTITFAADATVLQEAYFIRDKHMLSQRGTYQLRGDWLICYFGKRGDEKLTSRFRILNFTEKLLKIALDKEIYQLHKP